MPMKLLPLSASALLLVACADLVPPTSTGAAGPGHPPSFSSGSSHAIVINEVMADPVAVTDANWESGSSCTTAAPSAADLQGWTIHSGGDAARTIASVGGGPRPAATRCWPGNGDPGVNGGVTVDYAWGTGIGLGNSVRLAGHPRRGRRHDRLRCWWSESVPKGTLARRAGPCAGARQHDGGQLAARHLHLRLGRQGDARRAQRREAGRPDGARAGRRATRTPSTSRTGAAASMIDAGQGIGRIDDLIAEMGLNGGTLDLMLISHAHYDHHGGIAGVLQGRRTTSEVRYVFENQDATTAHDADRAARFDHRRGLGAARPSTATPTIPAPTAAADLHGAPGRRREDPHHAAHAHGRGERPLLRREAGRAPTALQLHHVVLSGDAEHEALDYFETAGYDVASGDGRARAEGEPPRLVQRHQHAVPAG
jgi:hypothetical protein